MLPQAHKMASERPTNSMYTGVSAAHVHPFPDSLTGRAPHC